jgi:hypothetical protein
MVKTICQNPYCSSYNTMDRLIKVEGKKYRADRVGSMEYFDNFCTRRCFEDWFELYGNRAIDLIGRKTERTINFGGVCLYSRRSDLINLYCNNDFMRYRKDPNMKQQIDTQLLREIQTKNNA